MNEIEDIIDFGYPIPPAIGKKVSLVFDNLIEDYPVVSYVKMNPHGIVTGYIDDDDCKLVLVKFGHKQHTLGVPINYLKQTN
jgi:hypothetical protein